MIRAHNTKVLTRTANHEPGAETCTVWVVTPLRQHTFQKLTHQPKSLKGRIGRSGRNDSPCSSTHFKSNMSQSATATNSHNVAPETLVSFRPHLPPLPPPPESSCNFSATPDGPTKQQRFFCKIHRQNIRKISAIGALGLSNLPNRASNFLHLFRTISAIQRPRASHRHFFCKISAIFLQFFCNISAILCLCL